jgi:hypothetical protein
MSTTTVADEPDEQEQYKGRKRRMWSERRAKRGEL